MPDYFIRDATIYNEDTAFVSSIFIRKGHIDYIGSNVPHKHSDFVEIDASGKWLLPGLIDVHVHFREPGLTHKGDILSESMAAVAGGVTSFIDMPNTHPKTTTVELLRQKYSIASVSSLANYAFYLGATSDNLEEMKKATEWGAPGIKVFLGASTGNMLVDDHVILEKIFAEVPGIIVVHAEDENTINQNLRKFRQIYGNNIPFAAHADIRSAEACYLASNYAVHLAKKFNTRLHLAHVSTGEELQLLTCQPDLEQKKITAETTLHHLLYDISDYEKFQGKLKCNPSVKESKHKEALLKGLKSGLIDLIATDHAPHTLTEKTLPYPECPSGIPFIQFSLLSLIELFHQGKISLHEIVRWTSHHPAVSFKIKNRGFIREGYFADLVLINPQTPITVTKDNIYSKCKWSTLEGKTFNSSVFATFVSGNLVYLHQANTPLFTGQQLEFE